MQCYTSTAIKNDQKNKKAFVCWEKGTNLRIIRTPSLELESLRLNVCSCVRGPQMGEEAV